MWLTELERLADPKYGLTVRFVDGWERRGASPTKKMPTGQPMSRACGSLWHHTAGSRKGNNPSRNILINGRAGLSGPLCHINLPRNGIVEVVAAGKANHAGKGIVRGVPRNAGNTSLVGIEAESAGTRPWDWTAAQLETMPLLGAALGDIFGWSASENWGHLEYSSTGKIDPAGLPDGMAGLRSRIAAVRIGSSPARPSVPTLPAFADVDKTQGWLIDLGFDPGLVDGVFGGRTQAATREAQQYFNITPADGLPGPATRTALEAEVSKLEQKIDRAIAIGTQNQKEIRALPASVARAVWNFAVTLRGSKFEGKKSTPLTTVAWKAHEHERVRVLAEQAATNSAEALAASTAALESAARMEAMLEKALTAAPAAPVED